jgi:hypothetical protein
VKVEGWAYHYFYFKINNLVNNVYVTDGAVAWAESRGQEGGEQKA